MEHPRARENDENVQPRQPNLNDRPNDKDRARFGFKKFSLPQQQQSQQKPQQVQEPAGCKTVLGASPSVSALVSPRPAATEFAIDIKTLLGSVAADPEELVPLVRQKLTSDQRVYKDRNEELTRHNAQYKEALKREIDRRRQCADVLSDAQQMVESQVAAILDAVSRHQESANQRQAELEKTQRKVQEMSCQLEQMQEAARKSQMHRDSLAREKERALLICRDEQQRADRAEQQLAQRSEQLQATERALGEAEEVARLARLTTEDCQRQVEQHGHEWEQRVAELKQESVRQLGDKSAELAKFQAEFAEERQRLQEASARQCQELREELSAKHAAQLQLKDVALAESRALFEQESQQKEDVANSERAAFQEQLRDKDKAMVEQRAGFQKLLREKDEGAAQECAVLQLQLRDKDKVAAEQRASAQALLQEKEEAARQQHAALEARFEVQMKERDDAAKQAAEDAAAELDQVKAAFAQAQATAQELRQQLSECRAEIAAQQEKAARLDGDVTVLQSQLATARNEHAVTRAAKAQVAAELEAAEAQIDAASSELEETSKAKSALLQEMSSLKTQLTATRAELNEEQLAKASQKSNFEEALRETQAQKASAAQKVESLSLELNIMRGRLDEELAAKSSLSTQAQELERRLAALRTTVEDSNRRDARLTKDMTDLQAQFSTVTASLDAERQNRSTLVTQVESLEQQLTDSKAEFVEQKHERQAECERANVRQRNLQDEVSALKEKLAAKTQEEETIRQDRDYLRIEYANYKEHHSSSNHAQVEAIKDLKTAVENLTRQNQQKQVELEVQVSSADHSKRYIQSLEQEIAKAEAARRELHNTIQELKGNIRVFCRVRPALQPGKDEDMRNVQLLDGNKLSLSLDSGEKSSWSFDRAFGMASTQEQVYDEVDGLVQSALDGYKVCIFAYGQTGSGKTFTMQGTPQARSWGIIPRALTKIFDSSRQMREKGFTWSLQASFVEVYNESLRDLLRSTRDPELPLGIRHDEAWGTVVTNALRVDVDDMSQIQELMVKASRQRAVGATDMNAQSSRSHSIFMLYLTGRNEDLGEEHHGALHLVDLAGSERLDKSGAEGDRLRETQHINKSLSGLADVFLAKAEHRSHIPFRNSKLTHLMEPCLSGHGKTLMVVNVSPETTDVHETLCSLRFAAQVSQCDTGGKPKRMTRRTVDSAASSSSSAVFAPAARRTAQSSTPFAFAGRRN